MVHDFKTWKTFGHHLYPVPFSLINQLEVTDKLTSTTWDVGVSRLSLVSCPLSKALQTKGMDLVEAPDRAIKSLAKKRLNADNEFENIFEEASTTADLIASTITMPKVA